MQTPYEVAAKSVIPAIRGMISRRLMERNFTQSEVAHTLGVTQPAVSKYIAEKRGRAIDFDQYPDVREMMDTISDGIVNRELDHLKVAITIKEACDYIMSSGYMCGFHYDLEPDTKSMNCKMCMEPANLLRLTPSLKK